MIKNKNFLLGVLVGSLLIVVILSLVIALAKYQTRTEINSFKECAQAGYTVMESYPRQCTAPDGQTFVEEIPQEPEEPPEEPEEEVEAERQAVPECSRIGIPPIIPPLKKPSQINDFEECTQAGYPVLQSYPRQCSTPDGRTFTEEAPPELTFSEATGKILVPKNLSDQAKKDLARRLGVLKNKIKVYCAEEVNWPDACLGIQQPDIACIQVITPGYRVILETNSQHYEYHTSLTHVVFAE